MDNSWFTVYMPGLAVLALTTITAELLELSNHIAILFYRKEPYASSKYLMDALSVAMNEKLKQKVTHVI